MGNQDYRMPVDRLPSAIARWWESGSLDGEVLAELIAAHVEGEKAKLAHTEEGLKTRIMEATAAVCDALSRVDSIRDGKHSEITYETMQKSGFKRKNWLRPYNLKDAKSDAANAAIRLRAAWQILDPT